MADPEKIILAEQRARNLHSNVFSTVWASKHMKIVARALNLNRIERTGLSQRMLVKIAQINVSDINKALTKLSKLGIAFCVNPERPRAKFYSLTTFGKNIVKWVNEYEEIENNPELLRKSLQQR